MKNSTRITHPQLLLKNIKRWLLASLLLTLAFGPFQLRAQYLGMTPCATLMVAGLDSLVEGLRDTSCYPGASQHRIVLPLCAMPGCNPSVPTPRLLYVIKSTASTLVGMYWHVRGAPLFWGYYSFCYVDTNVTVFPGGPGCSPNHVDYMLVQKIVNGVLVNETISNITSIKNPRLMTPASPFWSLVPPVLMTSLYSPQGILVDVTTQNGSYTATLRENYGNYIIWKTSRPCPTINSLAHSNIPIPGYGCQKFNFTATIGGYNILCPNSILTASWNFGDGSPVITTCADSTGISYAHQYTTAGSYVVTLTLNMAGTGTCVVTATDNVVVTCTPPPCSDCISSFAPIPGKQYLISAWAKETNPAQSKTSYTYPSITVQFPSISSSAGPFGPSGNIIDGWQRIEGIFTIPATATDMKLKLDCATSDCYYDDVRVLPFDGSMKSYVYDPVNLRLVAELDERNFATLYEYDEDGKLTRVKKETEKGKMTIKESRNNTKK